MLSQRERERESKTDSTQNAPVKSPNHIQVWARFVHIRDCLLGQNQKENNDAEIPGMQSKINTIQTTTNITDCVTVHELQRATSQIVQGWPKSRDQILQDMRTKWTF